MEWLSASPDELEAVDRHQWNIGAVIPRPIAWVTTLNDDGSVNLAPFSFFNAFSSSPPIVGIGIASKPDGKPKDTLYNLQKRPELVVNLVTGDVIYAMALSAQAFPYGVSEAQKAGLTFLPSDIVAPPRIAEAPVHIEAQVVEMKTLSERNTLVLARVVRWHARKDVLFKGKRIDPRRVQPVGRLGRLWYAILQPETILEIPIPEPGIGVDQLPDYIRHSPYLTLNDKARLAMLSNPPVEQADLSPVVKGLLANPDPFAALHHYAHDLIQMGQIEQAWRILRLSEQYWKTRDE